MIFVWGDMLCGSVVPRLPAGRERPTLGYQKRGLPKPHFSQLPLVDKLRTLDWGSIGKMTGEIEMILV